MAKIVLDFSKSFEANRPVELTSWDRTSIHLESQENAFMLQLNAFESHRRFCHQKVMRLDKYVNECFGKC
jgi:hypothetical protein